MMKAIGWGLILAPVVMVVGWFCYILIEMIEFAPGPGGFG